jgi:hypothetical protein
MSYFLEYPDKSLHPVKIPYPGWMSARVLAQISYILLREAMGYSAVLIDTTTSSPEHVVNYVAGCADADDIECAQKDLLNPIVHFTLESSIYAENRMKILPDSLRPIPINVLDYSILNQWCLWQDVLDAGLASPPYLSLDFFRSYSLPYFSPSRYFDPWTRVFDLLPPSAIIHCSDSNYPRDSTKYTAATNDSGVTCSHNDSVWFSPTCRANTSECVPLLLQPDSEGCAEFGSAMQIAALLRLPLALILVHKGADGASGDFLAAVRGGRFLFAWHQPDDRLADPHGRLPVPLTLPPANMAEQAQGLHRTGPAAFKPRDYGWRLLAQVDPLVLRLLERMDLQDQDMATFMLQSRCRPPPPGRAIRPGALARASQGC